ncbi:helicase-related protein [Demequina sp.]|uniref:helicase-related protein n=1 Tax=Demequina sp. TaxID=2050685 RepID=UPI0025BA878A|nr:helicase-related protein [Demequina sp.]
MTLTAAQEAALKHIRSAYIGPEGGPNELIVNGRPNLQYSVGMLFPPESDTNPDAESFGTSDGDDGVDADVAEGEVEDLEAGIPLAEDWRPSSVAISFVTDSKGIKCEFAGGTYAPIDVDGPPQWRREPFAVGDLELSADAPPQEHRVGEVTVEIGSRWRPYGDASLVTVHARILTRATGDSKADAALMLYQVALAVVPGADGQFLEYDTSSALDTDSESSELRLRYANRKNYAVGHGMAADWEMIDGACARVFIDPVPSFVVPAVETVSFDPESVEAQALQLEFLSTIDSAPDSVANALDEFVNAFSQWVKQQEDRVAGYGASEPIANDIVGRSRIAADRMRATVELLRSPNRTNLRTAFALAMAAMRLQMRQARVSEGKSPDSLAEPAWRPFQLGFILVSLASAVDENHEDRELVDLIWYPTGGGKTEAYLGLAAIEMFRRRLDYGAAGGGTAVVTRYTLRLLTAQQFHRAAALVCAMELLRRTDRIADVRARGVAPFSIGLWVGNQVTPGSRAEARRALERLLKAARPEEANRFQIESCPWCGASLLPTNHSADPNDYGIRAVGNDVVVGCISESCEFQYELPVSVVDEMLYENPPTFLLATVDKFARMQFRPDAGRLLGLGTTFRQPSMIIQDELHLLSGPLGTTVAVFDAAIQLLARKDGTTPKIIASTATIRSSAEQVTGLYGREVALYPPSGLEDDRNFFSRPVASGEGRLYLGLMPQSMSQASAVIAAAAPLLELPEVVSAGEGPSKDAYWTAVMYHNSLRELGRTGTLVVDDVNARLAARADRLSLPLRGVRPDRVLELTSRRGPEELPNDLRELGRSIDTTDQAIDVVLSSNMLSVGIDVPRLALMLMVGQPKTTSEYIQATSRVGRGDVRGIVATLFRSNRARDRSQFETFRGYHESLYRTVEPTSVTPWSLASRERSLAGALVMLIRQQFGNYASNEAAAHLDLSNPNIKGAIDALLAEFIKQVAKSDNVEEEETATQLQLLLADWDRRASEARRTGTGLTYERSKNIDAALLKRFGQPGEGWLVADSMRSVDPSVAVEVREPEGGSN